MENDHSHIGPARRRIFKQEASNTFILFILLFGWFEHLLKNILKNKNGASYIFYDVIYKLPAGRDPTSKIYMRFFQSEA